MSADFTEYGDLATMNEADLPPGSGLTDGDYTDVTVSAGATVFTIKNGVVTLAKQANLAANTIIGNNTGAPATPIALTASQVKTLLAITNTDVSGLGTLATQNDSNILNRLGYISGQYVNQAINALAATTLAGAANRIELYPYCPTITHSIDRLGVYVTTGVASAQCKFVIYTSDANGYASTLVYESLAQNVATSSTLVEVTMSYTFNAGTIYWVGVRHSSTATLRAVALGAAPQFGTTSTGTAFFTCLRRTLTFATSATNPWAFTNTDRTAGIAPTSMLMRIAP